LPIIGILKLLRTIVREPMSPESVRLSLHSVML